MPMPVAVRSKAARLLGMLVQIPPGTWIYVSCECFVMSVGGHCIKLIMRSCQSYRVCAAKCL